MILRTLISLLLCASVQAADITLAWDDTQQGVTFDVWRDVVTAVNEIGESERSNVLALRVDVTVLEN